MRLRSSYLLLCLLMLLVLKAKAGLTNGPVQNDFMPFEQAENTSLVNMVTGNMVYTMPLGKVNDPSGTGYPITLAYHSGITNEQEATWVGLGWGLNVGAINRDARGFPDDYNGENYLTHTYAQGVGKDWFYSTGGGYWHVALSFTFHDANWGDEQSFGLWSNGVGFSYGGTMMMNMNHDGSATYSNSFGGITWGVTYGNSKPEWFFSQSHTPIGSPAGVSIDNHGDVTWKFFSYTQPKSYTTAKDNFTAESKTKTVDLSHIGIAYSWTRVITNWAFDEIKTGRAIGYLYQSPYAPYEVTTDNPLVAEIMKNQNEDLHWDYRFNDPAFTSKPAVFKKKRIGDRMEYANMGEYSMAAQDIYSINAQGYGGVFKPINYHSMVTSYSANEDYNGLAGKPKANPNPNDDPFEYYFNSNEVKISPKYTDGMVFKMIGEASMNLVDNTTATYSGSDYYKNIDGTNNKTWGTRIEPIFGLDPQFTDKLTGFVVTTQGGMTYYFTKPLFSLQNISLANSSKDIPKDITKCNGTCQYSYNQDYGAYATSWLLTALTGPDYIKKVFLRQQSETMLEGEPTLALENFHPHQGDFGYWVSFRYEYGPNVISEENRMPHNDYKDGNYDKVTFPWQYPYKNWRTDRCKTDAHYTSFGLKEVTYLKSIETASEVAYFRTSPRNDGQGLALKDYPEFHNEYWPINVADITNDKIKEPDNNDKCYITEGVIHRDRICRMPAVIPNSTEINNNTSINPTSTT
jgi:hypothetical protein